MAALGEAIETIEGITYSGRFDFRGYEGTNSEQEPVFGGDIYIRPPFQGSEEFFSAVTLGQAKMRHDVTTQSISVVRVEVRESDATRASYKIAGFGRALIEKLNQIETN